MNTSLVPVVSVELGSNALDAVGILGAGRTDDAPPLVSHCTSRKNYQEAGAPVVFDLLRWYVSAVENETRRDLLHPHSLRMRRIVRVSSLR